jgi:hypothetical protein
MMKIRMALSLVLAAVALYVFLPDIDHKSRLTALMLPRKTKHFHFRPLLSSSLQTNRAVSEVALIEVAISFGSNN